MLNDELNSESLSLLRAVSSSSRLQILELLKHPEANFPPQLDGDLKKDGVCSDFIREKLGVSPATASRHLNLLVDAGLLTAIRKKGWVFYQRDEVAIEHFTAHLRANL